VTVGEDTHLDYFGPKTPKMKKVKIPLKAPTSASTSTPLRAPKLRKKPKFYQHH
jgi:hypothetical protein